MAENRVTIEGMYPPGSSLPVAITNASPSAAPSSANILAGSVIDDSAIITIPANRIWYGWISLTAALAGASSTSTVSVNTTGTGVIPADTVNLLALTLSTGTTNDGIALDARTPYIYVYAGSTAATLDVTIDGAATNAATAYGFLL